jgi:hypothetical protein
MDPNITARPSKPRIRMVVASDAGCKGCDLLGKIELCRGKGPGTPCVTPGMLYHAKITGEVPSTR